MQRTFKIQGTKKAKGKFTQALPLSLWIQMKSHKDGKSYLYGKVREFFFLI